MGNFRHFLSALTVDECRHCYRTDEVLQAPNWHPNWHPTRDDGPVRGGIANSHHPRKPVENREIRDTPLFGGTGLFGFEARAPHRGAILFLNFFNTLQDGSKMLETFIPDSAFSHVSVAAR